MKDEGLAKVWPLKPGVPGLNAAGGHITLQPGQPGWMPLSAAQAAQKEGTVQLMAGQTPDSLRQPEYETVVAKARTTREMTPKDEDEDFLDIGDKSPVRGTGKPPSRPNYKRRDTRAGK